MNTYTRLIAIAIAVIFSCCHNAPDKKESPAIKDTVTKDKSPDLKIFGDRLKIAGDFDGDGKTDTIYESYISSLTGKETFKTLDSTDWENNRDLIVQNKPLCRLYANINGTDTFLVTDEAQQTGIRLLENLGDLNNDKGDELGYIIALAHNSNLNHYYILSLTKEKKWKSLFDFPINEAVNEESENLYKNKYLIQKEGGNKIKYKFYSDSATVEEGETILP
jgi:hypothetical protein